METKKVVFDYSYLRGYLKHHNYTLEDFGNVLNITRQSVGNKLRNKTHFTFEEIELAKQTFKLTDKQILLFFYTKVSK